MKLWINAALLPASLWCAQLHPSALRRAADTAAPGAARRTAAFLAHPLALSRWRLPPPAPPPAPARPCRLCLTTSLWAWGPRASSPPLRGTWRRRWRWAWTGACGRWAGGGWGLAHAAGGKCSARLRWLHGRGLAGWLTGGWATSCTWHAAPLCCPLDKRASTFGSVCGGLPPHHAGSGPVQGVYCCSAPPPGPRQGYSWAEDKEHCEEYGRMLNADPSKVSARAKKRGLPQVRRREGRG